MAKKSVTLPSDAIKRLVREALNEDRASEDATSRLIPARRRIAAVVLCEEDCVLAGTAFLPEIFGGSLRWKSGRGIRDGRRVLRGSIIGRLEGSARKILSRERTALNLLSHLSGIATLTRRYVDQIPPGCRTRILDTRKTLPGLRLLEKYAVRCGGGVNHRFSLAENIFLKDNHLASLDWSSWRRRLLRLDRSGTRPFLIVEVDAVERVEDALSVRPNRILLDNLSNTEVRRAMRIIDGRAEIEVSGGVTPDRVKSLARLGVDYISVGALTISAPAIPFSLEVLGPK
ncbi:MAG: carboxylating nicotinate-nucleotide diphosphorylase [Candidatus Hydrogenedentota bacterium]|nr:MAG: carboxylating nicotinate-nucleotide diphosphorylase [Candidatus Hydrogenedentota bacterium]